MTNLSHLWFLHSPSHPLPKGRALCVCVSACAVFRFVVLGYFILFIFILNFIICMLLCIYNREIRGFTSISGFATCVLWSVTWIPCPVSLFQHTLPCCSSIRLKDIEQVDAKYKKDQLSQRKRVEGWERGCINYAGHDFRGAGRPWVL